MPVVLLDRAHAQRLDRQLEDPARVAGIIAEEAQADFVYSPVSTAINGPVAGSPKLNEAIEL
jgi:putative SOS response-associated peptidase YedK